VKTAVVCGVLAISLAMHGAAPAQDHDGPAAVEIRRGPDGVVVKLDAGARERIGLRVIQLTAAELPAVVRGLGHVLDPTVLAPPVYDLGAARAAFEVAGREYDRVRSLQRGNSNASQRDLEAARVAFERERAALHASEARLRATWGREATERADLVATVERLAAGRTVVARVDVPLDVAPTGAPARCRVAALVDGTSEAREASLLGPAPGVDPAVQGHGFLLLVEGAPWPPGTAVAGWLELTAAPRSGVQVPSAALLRHAGERWVYVQVDDGFVRRAVHLEQPTQTGWFVTRGVAPGESVVVVGAQQLLSAELGGANERD
jgi:hypothetical protein